MTDEERRNKKIMKDRYRGVLLRSIISVITLVLFLVVALLIFKYCSPAINDTTSSFDDETKVRANDVVLKIKDKCSTLATKEIDTLSYLDYYEESDLLYAGFTYDSGDSYNVGFAMFIFDGSIKGIDNILNDISVNKLNNAESYVYYYEEDKVATKAHLPSDINFYITNEGYTLDPKLHKSINYDAAGTLSSVGTVKLVKQQEVKFFTYSMTYDDSIVTVNEALSGSLYAATLDNILLHQN